jgi:hypothetical protein
MKLIQLVKALSVVIIFMSCSPTTPTGNNVGSNIVGVWQGRIYNTFTQVQEFDYKVFLDNGTSLSTMPISGLYNFNLQSFPAGKGQYTFNNNSGSNTWNGSSNSSPLTINNNNELILDGNTYYKCKDITGKKIDGSFTSFANPQDPDLLSLPQGDRPILHLKNDGTFVDEGLFNTILFDKDLNPSMAPGGVGTYELKNHSIIINYTDGRTRQEAFNGLFASKIETANIVFLQGVQLNKM